LLKLAFVLNIFSRRNPSKYIYLAPTDPRQRGNLLYIR
jgi:hypothetical protein